MFILCESRKKKETVFKKWIFEEFAKNCLLFYHFVLIEWNKSQEVSQIQKLNFAVSCSRQTFI